MKNIILILSIILILGSSSSTSAQDSLLTKAKTRKFFWEMTAGYSSINLDKINNDMDNLGLEKFNTGYKYVSIAFGHYFDRLYYRGELHIGTVDYQQQSTSVYSKIEGYGINLGVGYVIIDEFKYRIQTYAGFNGNSFNLEFRDYLTFYPDDIAEAASPNQTTSSSILNFGGTSLDLAGQIDYLISRKNKRWGCPQETRYFNIGMRMGYRIPISSNKYDTPVGPYVSLVLGSIRTKKALDWK